MRLKDREAERTDWSTEPEASFSPEQFHANECTFFLWPRYSLVSRPPGQSTATMRRTPRESCGDDAAWGANARTPLFRFPVRLVFAFEATGSDFAGKILHNEQLQCGYTPLQCTTAPYARRVDRVSDNAQLRVYYNMGHGSGCMGLTTTQASKEAGLQENLPYLNLPSLGMASEVSVHLVAILAIRGAPLVIRLERVRTKPRLIGKIHPLRCEDAGHHRIVGGLGALVPLLRVDKVLPAHA